MPMLFLMRGRGERIRAVHGYPVGILQYMDAWGLIVRTSHGETWIPEAELCREGKAWLRQFQSTRPASTGYGCRVGRATVPKLSKGA
jgi:hypothetical protein